MDNKKIHVMAIGAHAGDMELTCGAVLTKYAMNGHKVTLVHMTSGEKGHPILSGDVYKKQKDKEANEFAGKIGAQAMILPYKDGELLDSEEVKFYVCDLIRQYKPDILITHWKNSIHKDHEATYKIVKDAVFYASIKSFQRDLSPHCIRALYFAENWEDPEDFKPYIYIDVSETYNIWIEALKSYEFIGNSPYFKYLDYYNALSIVRGAECRRERAETFAIEPLGIKQIFDYFPVK
ncbi:PIG-L deacetylase family protein [Clostridium rectalis]|uniref:PIG-L deacetylase family protein n=1 Tax=Clostridium rectalis TaxID=2040295 RepID=UPI000F638621|nr:PIG-L deacetylase family protein [Clostridium rectalis]